MLNRSRRQVAETVESSAPAVDAVAVEPFDGSTWPPPHVPDPLPPHWWRVQARKRALYLRRYVPE